MSKRIPKQEPEIEPVWAMEQQAAAMEQQAACHRETVLLLVEEVQQLERIIACYRRDAEIRLVDRIENGTR